VTRLEAALAAVLARSHFELGEVELLYRPSPPEAVSGEEAFLAALERLSGAEQARRRVLAGPHRDDLEILWRNGPVGRMASAGERKLLGLALMVAHAELLEERGQRPLALIDDLDAELDRRRVGQVWELLGGERQTIAATSRKGVVNRLPADARWRLEDGFLHALRGAPEQEL
jgi:DNA replication and repair protein RecF